VQLHSLMNQLFTLKETRSSKHISLHTTGGKEYQESLYVMNKMASINKRMDCENGLSSDKYYRQNDNMPTGVMAL